MINKIVHILKERKILELNPLLNRYLKFIDFFNDLKNGEEIQFKGILLEKLEELITFVKKIDKKYGKTNILKGIKSLNYASRKCRNFVKRKGKYLYKYLKYYLSFSISVIFNLLCIINESFFSKGKENLCIFESCPIDQDYIKTSNEVDDIYDAVIKTKVNPIVRKAVSIPLYKNTIKDNKPTYIHFACHGNLKGLCFLGRKFKTILFSSDSFLSINDKILNTWVVRFVYINACESDIFASKVRKSKNKKLVRYYKTLGCKGLNDDVNARTYSKLFYENIFNIYPPDVCRVFRDIIQIYKKGGIMLKPNYINKMTLCKR